MDESRLYEALGVSPDSLTETKADGDGETTNSTTTETTEKFDGVSREANTTQNTEQQKQVDGETSTTTAEGAAKKPEQTVEERARFADLKRKQQLEKVSGEMETLVGQLRGVGFTGTASEIAAQIAAQQAEFQKVQRAEQEREFKRQSDETGIPIEYFEGLAEKERLFAENEGLRQRIEHERVSTQQFEVAKRFNSVCDEFDRIEPNFIENMTPEMGASFQNLILSNLSPAQIFKSVSALRPKQRQQRSAGTEHLKSVSGISGASVTVPPETMKIYKQLNPQMTNAEIQADYTKYLEQ